MHHPTRPQVLCLVTLLATVTAFAQEAELVIRDDDVPIEAYLTMLAQVAPAARDGAEVYRAAFQNRCGRPLKAVELRRAIAERSGDPTLLAMMRASQQKDTASLQRLAAAIVCPGS